MKTENLSEMMTRVRRFRASNHPINKPLPLPPGLAQEIARNHHHGPSARLLLFQGLSFAGLGVAATIALSVLLFLQAPEISASDPTGPWMEMPMSELAQ